MKILAIAVVVTMVASAQASCGSPCTPVPKCCAAPTMKVAQDESVTATFSGPKANTGAVVMTTTKAGITLKLTDAFKTPDTPDPHWQVVDREGRTYLLQRIDIKDMKSNRMITLPEYVTSVAKVQIWCAFAETNLGEATYETPKASVEAKKMGGHDVHTTGMFMGPKANKGVATHTIVDGKSTLTLSDDFVVPDTPDPHWSVIDSKGRMYLLQRLPIKDGKVNKKITVPDYVPDVAIVRIWCAFAEVNLGEAKFEHPVK